MSRAGGEYRDDLAAAHSRIAELEEKVRALSAGAALVPDGRFPELEARIAVEEKRADEAANARRRSIVTIIGAFFPFFATFATYLQQPVLATVCSAIFIALVIYGFTLTHSLKTAKTRLAEAEDKLKGARRIADLEAQLAGRVRVAVPTDTSVVEEPLDEEPVSRGCRVPSIER